MASGRAWAVAVAVAAGLTAASSAAVAEDLGSGRRVQGTTRAEAVRVGDADGHVVGVVEFKGLTFFAGGEVASHVNAATFDLTNGSGPHRGYVVHYFEDGSTSTERYQGEAKLAGDGRKTLVEGTFECVGGTGRFEGLKGEGTYKGERFGGLQAGEYVYIDFTGSCTTAP